MKATVGFDTNVLVYLAKAMTEGYDPKADQEPILAREKVAAFRIFLYIDAIAVGTTVSREIENTRSLGIRHHLTSLRDNLLVELVNTDAREIEKQARLFGQFHKGTKNWRDCLVVAEAVIGGLKVFLTFDCDLSKRLDGRTGPLCLMTPSDYWEQMNVPHGQRPRWSPAKTNPLYHATWWHW